MSNSDPVYRCALCDRPSTIDYTSTVIGSEFDEALKAIGWTTRPVDRFIHEILCPDCAADTPQKKAVAGLAMIVEGVDSLKKLDAQRPPGYPSLIPDGLEYLVDRLRGLVDELVSGRKVGDR